MNKTAGGSIGVRRCFEETVCHPSETQRFGLIMPQLDDNYVFVPEGDYHAPKALPDGVMRIGADGLAARRLLTPELERVCAGEEVDASPEEPVRIAAFDFDGTSISGNSPVLLVSHLAKLGMLKKSVIARIMAWAAAYKLRLPQNESWVRTLVFSAFRGKPVSQVNQFLGTFYEERVEGLFREEIDRIMREHLEHGHVVVCVSATFEPIVAKAMTCHPVQFGIATRMQIDEDGCYTDRVDGLPVEGAEKVVALKAFADELFGAGRWVLEWAYGDHHSDRDLLASARHGCAVTPDRPLARTARECGYDVLDIDGD